MSMARIRKDDTVIVVSGTSAGKTGKVKSVDRKKGTAVVEGVNVHKKAVRRTEKAAGGIIEIDNKNVAVGTPVTLTNWSFKLDR